MCELGLRDKIKKSKLRIEMLRNSSKRLGGRH